MSISTGRAATRLQNHAVSDPAANPSVEQLAADSEELGVVAGGSAAIENPGGQATPGSPALVHDSRHVALLAELGLRCPTR